MEDIKAKQEEQNLNQITQQLDDQQLLEEKQKENQQDQSNDNEIDENDCTETINQIDKLQNIMNKALQIVSLYKNEIDELRSKIGDMKEIILQRDVQDKERVVPIIQQLSLIYREEFSKLMDQNRQLEDELVTAIKEKQEVVEQIYTCVDKIKLLEQQVFKGEIPPYLKKKLEEQKEKQQLLLQQLQEQATNNETEQKEIESQQNN